MHEEGHAQREHNQYLDSAEDGRRASREADTEVGEDPHDNGGGDREDPPWDVDAGATLQKVGQHESEEADRPCRPDDVVDQVAPRSHETEAWPQAARCKRVVATARRHIA